MHCKKFGKLTYWHEKQLWLSHYLLKKKICLFDHTTWGILAPWPGSNPRPLHWKHRVLTTGIQGISKSLSTLKSHYFPIKNMHTILMWISSVQLLSCVQILAIPCTAAHQASLSITYSRSCEYFPQFAFSDFSALSTPSLPKVTYLWSQVSLFSKNVRTVLTL